MAVSRWRKLQGRFQAAGVPSSRDGGRTAAGGCYRASGRSESHIRVRHTVGPNVLIDM